MAHEKKGVHGSNNRRRAEDHSYAGGSNHYNVDDSNQNDLLQLMLYKKETARLLKVSDYLHEDPMTSLKD
ncbi:hypothetical protein QYF36_002596 [Acer negundo]|nr:hypothetical protein QYF36_002596 [Acer negundo]